MTFQTLILCLISTHTHLKESNTVLPGPDHDCVCVYVCMCIFMCDVFIYIYIYIKGNPGILVLKHSRGQNTE